MTRWVPCGCDRLLTVVLPQPTGPRPLPLGHHMGGANQQQAGHSPHVLRGSPTGQVSVLQDLEMPTHPKHRAPQYSVTVGEGTAH